MEKMLKIGELAVACDSTIDTIRFYESKGLLNPGERSDSGYRHYTNDAITILKFIQLTKDLGFTLTEIKEFLKIKIERSGKCSLAFEKILSKQSEIDSKIKDLNKIKRALNKISKHCLESSREEPCHFLDLFNK